MTFLAYTFSVFVRLISYLFHAHNMGWIYKQLSNNDFNGSFVHDVVTKLLAKTNSCIERSGVRACVFMYNSRDGNLDVSTQLITRFHVTIENCN